MTTKTTKLPDPPITGDAQIKPWWAEWFRSVKEQFPLNTVDTAAGNVTIALPSGAVYMNREPVYIKSSADANTVAITGAQGGTVTLTAQFNKARFRYDGSKWWAV